MELDENISFMTLLWRAVCFIIKKGVHHWKWWNWVVKQRFLCTIWRKSAQLRKVRSWEKGAVEKRAQLKKCAVEKRAQLKKCAVYKVRSWEMLKKGAVKKCAQLKNAQLRKVRSWEKLKKGAVEKYALLRKVWSWKSAQLRKVCNLSNQWRWGCETLKY